MQLIKPKADLIYGASGLRKTTNIGLAAMFVWKRYGKRTRLVCTDGGGFDPLLPLIEAGIIEPPWVLNDWAYRIDMLDKAAQGFWPTDVNVKNSQLRPFDDKCEKEIGLVAFEGLTSKGDLILRHLRDQKAKLSQDPSYILSDGTASFAGSNMSYFGFVQDRLYDMVMKSHLIRTEKVLWTALEARGEEEGTRIPIFGPAIAGKKSISKATQWFGSSLHIEAIVSEGQQDKDTKQVSIVTRPVMYLRPHADPLTKTVFACKTRAPYQYAHELPEFIDPPDIAKLWEMLDEMNERAVTKLKATMQPAVAAAPVAAVAPAPSTATAVVTK